MADPLSITASIIAVVGAAEGVTKTLAKIKSIRNAPDELLALINEVSDLKIILRDLQNYVNQNMHRPQISQEELQNISILINRAKDKLLELDKLIQYKLVKPESITDQVKVSRREWLRAKSTIERFRQSLRDIKLNIMTQMMVINSSHQSRIGLTIDEIHIISGQLQTVQDRSSDRTNQQLDEHSRLLANILSSQSNLQSILEVRSSPDEQARLLATGLTADLPLNSVVRVRGYTSEHQRSPCTPSCLCACHNVQAFQSPALLHGAIGTLFIGYSGYPIKAIQKCTEASCVSQSTFRAYVHYLFPSWFLIKALTITLMSVFLDKISVSLTVRRIVPNGAELFRVVRQDDVDGIKRLFSMGLASPNDSVDDGQTALTSAILNHKPGMCRFLLEAGADPHLDDFNAGRGSPFQVAWNYIFAGSGKPNTLEAFRELFPDKNGALEERGFTRFHKTVLGITGAGLEQEIKAGLSDIDSTDSDGSTALTWAARRGDCTAVDLLIKAGADVNKPNNSGTSALLSAVRSVDLRCVRALLTAGADSTIVDCHGGNALHFAALFKSGRDIVKSLVEASADVNQRDNDGSTPLALTSFEYGGNLAGSKLKVDLAEALLDYGADINTTDNDGDTPLHNAIHWNDDATTQLFLQRGAVYTQIDNIGSSVLHFAAVSGGLKTIEILFAAKLRGIDTEAVNKEGKTALHLVQERFDKPEGFLEKFEELLMDIRTRNATTTEGSGANSEFGEGRWWSKYLKRTPSVWIRFISWTTLVLRRAKNLKHANRLMSRKSLRESILIHWVMGLCFAGLLYIYSGLWLDVALEVISLTWEMVSPGNLEDL